jgi:tetratricopeptide (TPR) repeat protein
LELPRFAFLKEPIRVTTGHFGQAGHHLAVCVLAALAALAPVQTQPQESPGATDLRGTLQGHVHDSAGRTVANATVSLEITTPELKTDAQTPAASAQIAHTDSDGSYHFAAVRDGVYTLRAEMDGYAATTLGPVSLGPTERKTIDLALVSTKAGAGKPVASTPEFFDEPQFTVAGVTQATNSGGHGSDVVLRTTEALAKATVSLSKDKDDNNNEKESTARPKSAASPSAATETSLLQAEALNPQDPALHHRLGDVEEDLGKPLKAVREYQRAAELDPSELYLFDWGTELLTHRALEPATEVFTKGNRLFPKSVRMLVALGVAWYARGSYVQAAQCLANASDLAPDNPTPYLFLGNMQTGDITPLELSVTKLARFAQLQPDNALANYYYAVSLRKQSGSTAGSDNDKANANDSSAQVESLLQKAVHLDPKLGAAYLQLGILYSERADYSRAISAYQKAIQVTTDVTNDVTPEQAGSQLANPQFADTLEVAHYRLAQAFLRTGDKTRAKEEVQLHDQLAKKTKEDTERERREIQEFVISLRTQNSASPQPPQ